MSFAKSYLKTPGTYVTAVLSRLSIARERPGFVEMDAAMWRSFGTKENDLSDLAPGVKCPTLIVWGKQDPFVRAKTEGRRTRELLPHARYVELETGHVPFVERPEVFLDTVLPFLESIRGDTSTYHAHKAREETPR
jgi:pimeloyl-ACP methyl ester carboxylesterase